MVSQMIPMQPSDRVKANLALNSFRRACVCVWGGLYWWRRVCWLARYYYYYYYYYYFCHYCYCYYSHLRWPFAAAHLFLLPRADSTTADTSSVFPDYFTSFLKGYLSHFVKQPPLMSDHRVNKCAWARGE